jgi:DNA polymerase I
LVVVEGWILDLYPSDSGGEMVVWVKMRDGRCVRFADPWRCSIYVASDDASVLEGLLRRPEIRGFVFDGGFEMRVECITDFVPSRVLRLTLRDMRCAARLAEVVERLADWGVYRIYNADLTPAQSYLYEKDLFPFAYVRVEQAGGGFVFWTLLDDAEKIEYDLPCLKTVHLGVKVAALGKIPCFDDSIQSIVVTQADNCVTELFAGAAGGFSSEHDLLRGLVELLGRIDPDIVFTDDGDQFTVPYLIKRAEVNGFSEKLVLGRERDAALKISSSSGRSYFSYGRVLFRWPTYRFLGRIHIDVSHGFFFDSCGLNGLFEVARLCRIPVHTAARASIGKALGSLQFYHAFKEGVLVPWKPVLAEHPKTARELLVGDRGGFMFEPRIGVYSRVAELDFSSLYPTIMAKQNISAETVRCACCANSSSASRVPEVGFHICERRRGLIPKVLDVVLNKRLTYKRLSEESVDPLLKSSYDQRQTALKWILVCCFGYLSYRNAKFGRIDSHIAVCAYARKTLLDAARVAEDSGFQVIHGIVDSLWLQKLNVTVEDYLDLCREIERETGFPISFKGVYRWIAFLPSKMRSEVPVLNRYFGVFQNGKIKARGVECRRHDTPKIVSKCQEEMLTILSEATDAESVSTKVPQALQVLKRYSDSICSHTVSVDDLVIAKNLSKNPADYDVNIVQSLAAEQLMKEGLHIAAGQRIRYVITGHDDRYRRRGVAAQLADSGIEYDVEKYLDILISAACTLLTPFGYDKVLVRRRISMGTTGFDTSLFDVE